MFLRLTASPVEGEEKEKASEVRTVPPLAAFFFFCGGYGQTAELLRDKTASSKRFKMKNVKLLLSVRPNALAAFAHTTLKTMTYTHACTQERTLKSNEPANNVCRALQAGPGGPFSNLTENKDRQKTFLCIKKGSARCNH